jgi:hypothetical protein
MKQYEIVVPLEDGVDLAMPSHNGLACMSVNMLDISP